MTGRSANNPQRQPRSPAEPETHPLCHEPDGLPDGTDARSRVMQANRNSTHVSVPLLESAARLVRSTRH